MADFATITETVFDYTMYIMFSISALIGLAALLYVVYNKHSNFILVTYCIALIGDGVTYVLQTYYETARKHNPFQYTLAPNTTFDCTAHLLISCSYIKVIIEINALFDKQVHLKNEQRISKVRRQKKWLVVGGIIGFLICLADGVLCFVGF